MKRLLLAAALAAVLTARAGASWWVENDYDFGSNSSYKNSFTLFRNDSRKLTTGLNLAFYKDKAIYRDRVYSTRLPLMYSGRSYFLSLTPFLYPVSAGTRSGAYGGKLYLLLPLDEQANNSYTHLILSGAWARQKTFLTGAGAPYRDSFDQTAFGLQAEKSYYGQFFFLASASGFLKPAVSPGELVKPALDQSDLAYLGVFQPVTALPEWALTIQAARNMQPNYDSHVYAGYSKISFRNESRADSIIFGIKTALNDKSSLDMAYDAYKADAAPWKNYYKFLLQLSF